MDLIGYKEGEILKCPHCGKDLEYPVQDFVVTGSTSPYEEECGWCYEVFTVQYYRADDTYYVDKK